MFPIKISVVCEDVSVSFAALLSLGASIVSMTEHSAEFRINGTRARRNKVLHVTGGSNVASNNHIPLKDDIDWHGGSQWVCI